MTGFVALLGISALSLAQTVPPTPVRSPAPDSSFYVEPIVFVSERGDSVSAERGHLRVAENRSRVGGRSVDLTFVRFRSTAANPGAPIVYLAGGPGGSGQLVAKGVRFGTFMRLREVADVIVLDQRGTWGSGDLLCPGGGQTAPDSLPGTEANQMEAWRRWSVRCAQYWSERGVDLASYNTVESADDIDSVRSALGVPRVSLWAISYGTQLAQAYVRRHPDGIERIILAGPEPLDAVIKPPSQGDALIARLDSLIQSDPNLRRRIPNLRALIDSVHAKLDAAPARVVVRSGKGDSTVVGIGKFDVEFVSAFGFGNSALLRLLPKLYSDMAGGNYSGIAPFVLRLRHYNTTAMALTMDCATGVDDAGLQRARAEAAGSSFEMAANFPFPAICDEWPHRDLGSEFRLPVRSAAPTLFIAGTMDGRTPPTNIARIRPGFPNSRTLLIVGASHDDDLVVSDSGIADTMVLFLRDRLPADRTIQLSPWVIPLPN